ncbi:MAG: hypothetical protein COW24_00060 [Candidatus Kerfeldbacteria bacterium CG15_BIG_FIL_POST_REV_8_21_14_020_45_12]|uniref:Type IV secretion system coupling protein TraD DNA-binding domain-containing protein n=1 Tax=Candidatus Kerfeldbacteria bacterium CG15_BIG_FIL_POST_REV_8_21_14_020_45_12 TaxID=2014247 RepID=A0A2M7H5D6_9BACT|nr:MAG: hypothetical protein COW24_00060 [Candidatus Kerfeldbacteria bacterium CG15_BIG_FIL_POST_REV_8_21_14_020_45_12]PJA93607.1 MAG: hypothetical protein CO132_02135 [Candidatus Kerfeldbacteria bacterium CG_4_9_14_3_um_filter_45_8]
MSDQTPQLDENGNPLEPSEETVKVFDPEQVNFFAATNYRNENRRFGIKTDDRRRHMYLIGKTGMGKSTVQENMIIQDIRNGNGLAVVDPHGDLVEKIIRFIPADRINDVIYFNPADLEHPIAFNILESVNPEHKNLVSNGLVGVFKKIWADSWGPRLEYILINAILALIEYPGSTLLGVTRMLVDTNYRKKVVRNISDPVVKSFWVNEYNNYTEKFRNEAIAPIQNKVGQFLSSSLIRNIVGQSNSSMDMREVMDSGKILLMNLSKGRVGEENAALLGAMMITKIQLAAMSRVDIPEETRRDFFLYVDEFQNFSTESFAGILSEARKYRLDLILAHQYIEQLSDEVKAAVFGNVGTMVTFRVGATDAEELEKEFQPTFMIDDLVNLPAFHTYMRLMIDGVASEPFSATTLPPLSGETNNAEKVIRVSRERYARNRAEVEQSIARWSGMDESGDGDDDGDQKAKSKPAEQPKSVIADELVKTEPVAAQISPPNHPRVTPGAPPHRPAAPPPPVPTTEVITPTIPEPISEPVAPEPVLESKPEEPVDELQEFKQKGLSFVQPEDFVNTGRETTVVSGVEPESTPPQPAIQPKQEPQRERRPAKKSEPKPSPKPEARPVVKGPADPQAPVTSKQVRVQSPSTPKPEPIRSVQSESKIQESLPTGPQARNKPAPQPIKPTEQPKSVRSNSEGQPNPRQGQTTSQSTPSGTPADGSAPKKRRRRRRKKSSGGEQSSPQDRPSGGSQGDRREDVQQKQPQSGSEQSQGSGVSRPAASQSSNRAKGRPRRSNNSSRNDDRPHALKPGQAIHFDD